MYRILAIGFCDPEQFDLTEEAHLGDNPYSCAYLVDGDGDGHMEGPDAIDVDNASLSSSDEEEGNQIPGFVQGDVLGAGIDYAKGVVFFTKNGRLIPGGFNLQEDEMEMAALTPCVAIRGGGERTTVGLNTGVAPFRYAQVELPLYSSNGDDSSNSSATTSNAKSKLKKKKKGSKVEGGSIAYLSNFNTPLSYNGSGYDACAVVHLPSVLGSSRLAVLDPNSLALITTLPLDLTVDDASFGLASTENGVRTVNIPLSVSNGAFIDLKVQPGYKLEILSASVNNERDVTTIAKERLAANSNWFFAPTSLFLSEGEQKQDQQLVMKVKLALAERRLCLPMATFGRSLVMIESLGSSPNSSSARQFISLINDVTIKEVSFTAGGADETTNGGKEAFLARVKELYLSYLQAAFADGKKNRVDLFKQHFDLLLAEFGPALGAPSDDPVVQATIAEEAAKITFTSELAIGSSSDHSAITLTFNKAHGIRWNMLLQEGDDYLAAGEESFQALVLEPKEDFSALKLIKTIPLLISQSNNSKLPVLGSDFIDGGFLFTNGCQLLVTTAAVDKDGSLLFSWRFSLGTGELINYETNKLYLEDGITIATASYDNGSGNCFYGLNEAKKELVRWKNPGLAPSLDSSPLLLLLQSETDSALAASGKDQSLAILSSLEHYGRAFHNQAAANDSSSSGGLRNTSRMISIDYRPKSGSSSGDFETKFTVAGHVIEFDDGDPHNSGFFLITLDDEFRVMQKKFFDIENESYSTDHCVDFLDRLKTNTIVLIAVTNLQDENMIRSLSNAMKTIGIRDLQHDKGHKLLLGVGRKGLSPGFADFITETTKKASVFSRLIPPLHVPLVTEPTRESIELLLTLIRKLSAAEATKKVDEDTLAKVLAMLAANLRNLTGGLQPKQSAELLGNINVESLKQLVGELLQSKHMSQPGSGLQVTITMLFSSSMDLLYSTTEKKMELLLNYAAEYSSSNSEVGSTSIKEKKSGSGGGESEILRLLLTDVTAPKYFVKSNGELDRAYATSIFCLCEGLLRHEMKQMSDLCNENKDLTLTAVASKLFEKVVSVISNTATTALVSELQSISLDGGALSLKGSGKDKKGQAAGKKLSLFLEVFAYLARLSSDLISLATELQSTRSNKNNTDELFSFLERSCVGSILPAVVTTFTRLAKSGGYSFIHTIIEDALELVKELDRTVTAMAGVLALVPSSLATVPSIVPQKPTRKRVIESEHPVSFHYNISY